MKKISKESPRHNPQAVLQKRPTPPDKYCTEVDETIGVQLYNSKPRRGRPPSTSYRPIGRSSVPPKPPLACRHQFPDSATNKNKPYLTKVHAQKNETVVLDPLPFETKKRDLPASFYYPSLLSHAWMDEAAPLSPGHQVDLIDCVHAMSVGSKTGAILRGDGT